MSPPKVYADRYRLEDRLGAGAFGVVYAAFDEGLLQRRVALKLLSGAVEGVAPTEEQAARFIAELRLAGALRHSHIAAVYDAGVWQGQLYMVQELVDGVDLGRFLAEHAPLPVDFALSLALQMLDAVATAHEQGVVHRDLKPGNLLVDREHRVVVVDFGLATSSGSAGEPRGGSNGTPGYAAPEQVRGRGDARSDQFALGAVIYLLLTGVAPFVGKNLPETLRLTLLQDPPPPSSLRAELPAGLDRVVLRALAKDPAARYADLRELAAELAQHAAFAELASPDQRRAALAAAVGRDGLVMITAGEPWPWLSALRGAIAVVFHAPAAGPAGSRVLTDPRQEAYPTVEAPVCLALADEEALDRLPQIDDGLRAALMVGTVLVVDLPPEHPGLRRVLGQLRSWGPAAVTAVAARWRLDEVRAAQRRGLTLLEQPPEALRAGLVADLPPAPPRVTPPLPERPYKFLSYFDAGDEAIFFGRSTEIARLTARILSRPVVLLYGASGAGKTSLVRAALAPRLGRAGHAVVLARVFDDPLAEICRAAGLPVDPAEDRPLRLAAAAREGSLLVVVLDQLEELFVRFPRPAREAVAADLARALEAADGRLRLVLCLRADYLARLTELRGILPLSLECGLYLESLSSAAAREAVIGPAALHGVSVEPALIHQMIGDLSTEGIDPPSLQLICDALWTARAPGETVLTLRAYQALGEARSILARHLAAAIDGLPEHDRDAARLVLKAMVTTADTRSVRRLPELARGAGLSTERAARLLDRLTALRLVRPLEREDGAWFELAHEVLAAEIGRWLSEEDRRLSQVRELLEQGLRGHRQLGLLLSPAQVRLVTALEHRLDLGPDERKLLQASLLAERSRRRRLGALLVAAVALLLVAVVGGRAIWLSQHRFARATEGRLSWFRWDEPIEQVVSPVLVYRGAADPWWLDAFLGYPRDPYQTDWVLDDIQPAVRDALRVGVDLPDPAQARDWLVARLGPLSAARERFVAGDLSQADATLRALAEDADIGPADALSLASVLALGVPEPSGTLPAFLDIAQQRAAALRVPGIAPFDGRLGQPLALLLLRVPDEVWRPLLDDALDTETGPEIVGDLLANAGSPSDLDRLALTLRGTRAASIEAAVRAVSEVGDCAHIEAVRDVVRRGERAASRERVWPSYVQLARDCGSAEDVPLLEEIFQTAMRGDVEDNLATEVLRALNRIDRGRAQVLLGEFGTRPRLAQETTTTPWGYWGDRDMSAALTAGSPAQLHARLHQGDGSAVWPAWEFGFADARDPYRLAWLAPLAAYRGEALQRRALEKLRAGGLPTWQALPMMDVAYGRGDAAAAEAIALGLAGRDLLEVQTALNLLSALPVAAPGDAAALSRQARVGRGVVALRRGEPTDAPFLEVLQDPAAGYLETMLAIEGQRRLWRTGGGALAALTSPSARVRLAATLAVAERETLPTLDPGDDPWLAATLARVRWLHQAFAVDVALRARVRDAMDAGELRHARQMLTVLRSADGALTRANAVLAPQLPGIMPSERSDEAVYLQMVADANLGLGQSFQWMSLYVPPPMWPRYATEPLLAEFRDHYILRVLAGLQAPARVEDP